MLIGVPKEIKTNENRVALVPAGAESLTAQGHTVLVEQGAGIGSGFPDASYVAVGATIIPTADEVWQKSEMIMTPARFGASALAHTMVGYLAAWSRAFFFADNLAVIAGFLAVATWTRDLVVLLASGTTDGGLFPALFITAPLRALTTAIAGSTLLFLFRSWFGIRLDQ